MNKLYAAVLKDHIGKVNFHHFSFDIWNDVWDVGHCIVLFLLSIGLFLSGRSGFRGIVKFKEYASVLESCSLFSIFFGFMYGEFFGLKFTPLWLSLTEHIAYFLILSIWAGVLHLVLGLIPF